MRLRPSVLLAIAVLAGCEPASRVDAPTPSVAGAEPAPAPARPAQRPGDTVIVGEASYRERIKMPPGATLTVELLALDRTTPRVVATARVDVAAGPPIPFALPYEAARVSPTGRHGLRAMLDGPDGEGWFATPSPVPVVPGEGTPVDLLLQRMADGAPAVGPVASPTAMARIRHWECGELGVMARPASGGASLRIDANGRTWSLPAVRTGSGIRYADSTGTEFRSSGDTARWVVPGEPARDCVPARRPSPWNEAILRGIAWRAVGNEPGWFVEVGGSASPLLRATLDYGERRVEGLATRTATGFRSVAGGEVITLDFLDAVCTDGMSGQRFDSTVTLRVGDRRHEGCGARLDD